MFDTNDFEAFKSSAFFTSVNDQLEATLAEMPSEMHTMLAQFYTDQGAQELLHIFNQLLPPLARVMTEAGHAGLTRDAVDGLRMLAYANILLQHINTDSYQSLVDEDGTDLDDDKATAKAELMDHWSDRLEAVFKPLNS